MIRRSLPLLVMALFALLSVGCCPMTKLNISVELDKSFQDKYGKNRTVEVDVVGINPVGNARWYKYSMTQYWQAGDSLRTSAMNMKILKTLTFKSADLTPQEIKSDDPIWEAWLAGGSDKDPPQIYVLVQLPKVFDAAKDDKEGNEDARRQILTTKSCRWQKGVMAGAPTVKLVIDADRINTVTVPKSE
jgi:hypothetical protein